MTIDGTTGQTNRIIANTSAYFACPTQLRSNSTLSAGTYTITVYGYSTVTNNIQVQNCTLFALGNLN